MASPIRLASHRFRSYGRAALTYREVFNDEVALKAATVTKLTRNLFLAGVVPLLSFIYLRKQEVGASETARVSVARLFPLFVLGFVAMSVMRSVGDATLAHGVAFGLWSDGTWKALTNLVGERWGSRYLLGTAMAAVGLGTSFSVFKGVGMKPFVVGLARALLVGAVGLAMSGLFGQCVHL